MPYDLIYHADIPRDIARFPADIKKRIKRAIEERLLIDPVRFGDPLRKSLKGYRKFRVGSYRVIYEIQKNTVIILRIGHRKEVYEKHV